MKKIFERLVFMIVGALLVSAAYLVGNTDKTADAQFTTFEDVIVTGRLIVKGTVIVGDPLADHRNLVHIVADEMGSTISLLHNRGENSNDAKIMLQVSKADDTPAAIIRLEDKLGNIADGTSGLGWSKQE